MVREISESKKGLGLLVFCNKCKTRISSLKKCSHKKHWIYKADFKINGRRYTRSFGQIDQEEAFNKLFELKRSITNKEIRIKGKQFTVYEGVKSYLKYIHSIGEYKRNSSHSINHQKDCTRILMRFYDSLIGAKKDPQTYIMNDLDSSVLEPFYNFIEIKSNIKAPASFDKHTRILRSFLKFCSDSGLYSGSNFFKTIKTKKNTKNSIAISDDEFEVVIATVNYENGWTIRSGDKRNVYTPWLKDVFRLAKETGLRKEELYSLKWSKIIEERGHRIFVVKDNKVSKLKDEKRIKTVPITSSLAKLLDELKEKYIGDCIVDTGVSLTTFNDKVSRAFSNYYRIAFPSNEPKNFKQLRKSKITEISSLAGSDTYKVTGHSSNAVIKNHYLDQIEAAVKYLELEGKLSQLKTAS